MAYITSNLEIDLDNVEVLLKATSASTVSDLVTSNLEIDLDNVEVLTKGEVLFIYPDASNLRQIHSDSSKVYAATSKGLVVFSL